MREFLTASEIEALYAQGVRQIPVGDQIVLTDLGRERAVQLGMALGTKVETVPVVPKLPNSPSPQTAPSDIALGSRPRGCLHTHLETGSSAVPAGSKAGLAASVPSESIVQQLIEAIRRLNE
jgi:hypothetical protein